MYVAFGGTCVAEGNPEVAEGGSRVALGRITGVREGRPVGETVRVIRVAEGVSVGSVVEVGPGVEEGAPVGEETGGWVRVGRGEALACGAIKDGVIVGTGVLRFSTRVGRVSPGT